MVYQTKVQGIPVTSNVDPSVAQPHGSVYTHTISFNLPFVNYLAAAGLDLDKLATQLVSGFSAQGATITNASIATPDDYTVVIKYTATSPPVLLAIGVVLVVLAVIAWIIKDIVTTVVAPVASVPGGGYLVFILVIIIVGLPTILIFNHYYKNREYGFGLGKNISNAFTSARKRLRV